MNRKAKGESGETQGDTKPKKVENFFSEIYTDEKENKFITYSVKIYIHFTYILGCTTHHFRHPLTLTPVGPAPSQRVRAGAAGAHQGQVRGFVLFQ